MLYYTCIATEETPPRVMYAEHFKDIAERDKRAKQIANECYDHDGAIWKLYIGDEPIEAAYARGNAPIIKEESPEDRQIRLDALALKAAKSSKSKLTAPEFDNVPEWFKQGFSSQKDMDLQTKGKS